MTRLEKDVDYIIDQAISAVLPDEAVKRALLNKDFGESQIYLVAVGKAAWQMAKAAESILKDRIKKGIVLTKYGYNKGPIANFLCLEAGHPVPDQQSFTGTRKILEFVSKLTEKDTVLFLLSGGGSALFEDPVIPDEELLDITEQLLASGADIIEMNTIRKRLSNVKGGRFALACEPAKVYSIVLSDIVGDPLDMIASGPAYQDNSTCEYAQRIAQKYHLTLSDSAKEALKKETPSKLSNVETVITGSVKELCQAAKKAVEELGYKAQIITDHLDCTAKEAGTFLGDIAISHQDTTESLAWIVGGETVVHLTGKGKGGRNQEIALSAADKIAGCKDTLLFSVGSDGTDGPTDAAGGIVDGQTKEKLAQKGYDIFDVLKNNDAYTALKACNGLIITGATGTNVNDVTVLLIQR